ncbi:ABC transporter ATP-binding protein [Citrifermentans bremense]|uniref:ABC transporter ATP-binding protein n=1 Tax=Citrifermentans bremense TaxID=60035 RepID=UPI0004169E92|nr:ABC transporter ATP-binding protein [Citrifermentans bremense]
MASSKGTSAEAPLLEVRGVTLQYTTREQRVTATWRVDFDAWAGERLVLLGPSGCGKSTLLKAVGGYLKPVEGEVQFRGKQVHGPGPDRGMVFQEFDQLLPWKTVKQNVAFALQEGRGVPRREAEEQALHFIAKVKLSRFADAYPHTLSGGMKQRVAIARCLATRPELILMDEPFAALDALTRQQMQDELLELWQESPFAMLFVTHSIDEAVRLGHRVILLSPHPGRVKEVLALDGKGGLEPVQSGAELQERIHRSLFETACDYSI